MRAFPFKSVAAAMVVLLLVGVALMVLPSDEDRTVTARFSRTVAVYPGTELRVMGVRIGEVEAVVPDGDAVRVTMSYDDRYRLPEDAKAAIVTPTLVADRYVQVFPVHTEGPELPDGGVIPMERTNTPIELDRMYAALDDVAIALGPEPGQASGPLNNVLGAGARALEGNGKLGSEAIRNLSAAVGTLSDNRGPLFENVRSLASVTETLAAHDALVNEFIGNLSGVSRQLSGERLALRKLLVSLARALGTVRGFVKENRTVLARDVQRLGRLMGTIESEKDSLALVLQKGPLAMSNLAVAFEPSTGTFGSRVQAGQAFEKPEQFLCEVLKANGTPSAGQVCKLLDQVLGPVLGRAGGAGKSGGAGQSGPGGETTQQGVAGDDLFAILGGTR